MSLAGELTLLNIQPTGGADTCHVAIVNGGTHLVAANYQSGSVSVHPILPDGTLGERTCLVQHEGSGPDPDRQAGPHAHMIAEAPDGQSIFAVDLGTDTLYGYALDAATGTLTETSRTVLRPGFGPRHLAFHRNGEVVYVLGELGFEVAVCAFDAAAGSLTVLSTFPVIEDGEPGVDYPSGIRVTPGGRFLHVAVRGRDKLLTFSLVADPRKPELASTVPTGGSWPRDMVLSPDGTLLFSANQLSNELVVFRLDPLNGLPAADRRAAVRARPGLRADALHRQVRSPEFHRLDGRISGTLVRSATDGRAVSGRIHRQWQAWECTFSPSARRPCRGCSPPRTTRT